MVGQEHSGYLHSFRQTSYLLNQIPPLTCWFWRGKQTIAIEIIRIFEFMVLRQMYCEFSLDVREFCFSTTPTPS